MSDKKMEVLQTKRKEIDDWKVNFCLEMMATVVKVETAANLAECQQKQPLDSANAIFQLTNNDLLGRLESSNAKFNEIEMGSQANQLSFEALSATNH